VSFRGQGCDAMYLVDGVPVTPMGGMSATEMVSAMVSPQDIGGVEVYKGDASVPMELMVMQQGAPLLQGGSCGLIAIWSKR
jgi:hypothetical protein